MHSCFLKFQIIFGTKNETLKEKQILYLNLLTEPPEGSSSQAPFRHRGNYLQPGDTDTDFMSKTKKQGGVLLKHCSYCCDMTLSAE